MKHALLDVLRLVPLSSTPAAPEPLKPVTDDQAKSLYKNDHLANQWKSAVEFLRSRGTSRWVMDGARASWGHGDKKAPTA